VIEVKLMLLDEDLRKTLGAKEFAFDLPEGSTIRDLFEAVVSKYNEKTTESLLKDGMLIVLNGQNIEFLGGANASLSDGDRVAIIPPLEGG